MRRATAHNLVERDDVVNREVVFIARQWFIDHLQLVHGGHDPCPWAEATVPDQERHLNIRVSGPPINAHTSEADDHVVSIVSYRARLVARLLPATLASATSSGMLHRCQLAALLTIDGGGTAEPAGEFGGHGQLFLDRMFT